MSGLQQSAEGKINSNVKFYNHITIIDFISRNEFIYKLSKKFSHYQDGLQRSKTLTNIATFSSMVKLLFQHMNRENRKGGKERCSHSMFYQKKEIMGTELKQ